MTDGGQTSDAIHRIELALERLDGRMAALSELKALDHRRIEERIDNESHSRRKTDQTANLILDRLEKIPDKEDYDRLTAAVASLTAKVDTLPTRSDYERLKSDLKETDTIARANQISVAKLGALLSAASGAGGVVVVIGQRILGG